MKNTTLGYGTSPRRLFLRDNRTDHLKILEPDEQTLLFRLLLKLYHHTDNLTLRRVVKSLLVLLTF